MSKHIKLTKEEKQEAKQFFIEVAKVNKLTRDERKRFFKHINFLYRNAWLFQPIFWFIEKFGLTNVAYDISKSLVYSYIEEAN